jgi:hypothetical protein
LLLPLLVAGAPLAGSAVEWALSALPVTPRLLTQLLLCLFLLSTARRPALENWVRPLKGPRSVLHTPRDDQYFADMVQWNNAATYWRSVQWLAAPDTKPQCPILGIDATGLPLEYPLMALLRERIPGILFMHTGVHNASSRYAPPVPAMPCAVVCLDCAGDRARESLYSDFGEKIAVDKFVVFRK